MCSVFLETGDLMLAMLLKEGETVSALAGLAPLGDIWLELAFESICLIILSAAFPTCFYLFEPNSWSDSTRTVGFWSLLCSSP